MFSWTVPDEIVTFVFNEFSRFNAPNPPDETVDLICDHVLVTMAQTPKRLGPQQMEYRYHQRPGLENDEMMTFVGPLISKIQNTSSEQVHLIAWAAWMFCCSDEGELHVEWFKRDEIAENNKRQGTVLQFPPVAL